jgi:hypothetical protein
MNDISRAVVRHMSKYPFRTDEARRGLLNDIGEDGLRRFEEACEMIHH